MVVKNLTAAAVVLALKALAVIPAVFATVAPSIAVGVMLSAGVLAQAFEILGTN